MKQPGCKRAAYLYGMGAIGIIAVLTAFDQLTKQLAVSHLKEQLPIVLIDGILELRYLENTGIAFGMFAGKINFFILTCVVFFIAALYFFLKVPKNRFYAPLILIELVLAAGAVGNFIDRILYGYVIDFIYFKLIDFPIFNVADIYVVISCISLFLLILFRYSDDDFKFLNFKCKDKKHE